MNGVAPPVAEKEKEKVVEKVLPPTPPIHIRDKERGLSYHRVGLLGEGGFARVYEVADARSQHRALKVVSKGSIKSRKNKTKLWAEIKLHQMLGHPNIVRFDDCFEDQANVYMILELCDNGSLMDLVRQRKRLTEPEARYYLVQLIGACQYMHATNVIHRDLKLGNVFLDSNMDLKVGDFGLAALIEKPGDRKKTICGTPNYIAPEILFDTANGHSFEVDIWSVGVILYTMLIGKPPFQTKDVKAIYKRIKENRYEFPVEKEISASAKDLIMTILNQNPVARPNFDAILRHEFMLNGPFPPYLPASIHDRAPDFRHISASTSRRNFAAVCQKAKIGVQLPINTTLARPKTALGPSILQQERDFQNAIQPESPVAALLKSARQPLLQTTAPITEAGLLRKLNAAGAQSTLSPARRTAGKENRAGVAGPSRRPLERLGEEEEEEEEEEEQEEEEEDNQVIDQNASDGKGYNAGVRERELATQKARIVSQMTHVPKVSTGLSPRRTVPAQPPPRHLPLPVNEKKSDAMRAQMQLQSMQPQPKAKSRHSLFETFSHNLTRALAKAQTDEGFQVPHIPLNPPAPKVFVISWLDYCNKYGMGFAMSDGTVSVHFNDTSSLVLAPAKGHFDHIQPADKGDLVQGLRRNYPIDAYPKDLHNKVYLLKHFESYMSDRLYGDQEYTFKDTALTNGMVFVQRYLRMKHVILFRLSNDILQFNFYDHTKLILSQDGYVVSVIDKHYVLRTWSLQVLLQPMDDEINSKERRRMEGVIHKIQYARDVLSNILKHNKAKPATTGGLEPELEMMQPDGERARDMRPIR